MAIVDELRTLRTALSRAEQRIVDLEASRDNWHGRACSYADALHEALQRLATAIPEDLMMRNQELSIKLATAERERDEARKDSRRIDCLEQVMRVVMPSGRHWIDYDYSGDLRSALDTSMEKLT